MEFNEFIPGRLVEDPQKSESENNDALPYEYYINDLNVADMDPYDRYTDSLIGEKEIGDPFGSFREAEKNFEEKTTKAQETISFFKDQEILKSMPKHGAEYFSSFFSPDKLRDLKEIPQKERLFLLAQASQYITNTKKDFQKYLEIFPEDLEQIEGLYLSDYFPNESNILGKINDQIQYTDMKKIDFIPSDLGNTEQLKKYLYSISAPEIKKKNPEYSYQFITLEDYCSIAEKREKMPQQQLENFSENLKKELEEYPDFLTKLKQLTNQKETSFNLLNSQFDISYKKGSRLLDESFDELDESQKNELLRKSLAYIQYLQTFEESFNRTDINPRKSYAQFSDHMLDSSMYKPKYQQFDFDNPINRYEEAEKKIGYTFNPFIEASKEIISKMGESQIEQDINSKTVVDFWDKSRNPLLIKTIAEAISKQNPEIATQKLIELINKETDDSLPLSSLIYRLELGKIGISEEGVNYLGKIYDLENYNNPDYHASRLTNQGEIGIFNEEMKLIKYFELKNLTGKEQKIKAKLLDFTYEKLFRNAPDDDQETITKKEEVIKNLTEHYYEITNQQIFKDIGIHLNDLSFKEQGWFLLYLESANEEEKNEIKAFIKTYGETGIKTFLAVEDNQEMGEKIINIGNKIDAELAQGIFLKYNQIMHAAERADNYIKQILEEKDIDDRLLEDIKNDLIQKATNILLDSEELSDKKFLSTFVWAKLDSYRTDILLTASIYKTLHKEGSDIRPEDLEGVTFEIKNGKEIFQDKETFNEMCRIYINNYADKPKLAKSLAEGFEEQLKSRGNKTRIYIYKKDGHVMAFNRFDDKFDEQEDAKYFGSFNVQSELQDSSLGSALFQKSLEEETKERKPIKAVCFSFSSATVMYIEKGGFIANQFERLSEDPSSPVIHIEKNENFSPKYSGKTQDEIISEYQENLDKNTENDSASIVQIPISDKNQIDSTMEEFLNNKKYLLTRYFCDSQRNNVYAVFEKGA